MWSVRGGYNYRRRTTGKAVGTALMPVERVEVAAGGGPTQIDQYLIIETTMQYRGKKNNLTLHED